MFGLKRRILIHKLRKGVENLLKTKVKDVDTDYVITIPPDKSVIDAASIMIGEDVSALIVEEEGKPIGILTERDFISKVPLSNKTFSLKVKNIMSCSLRAKKEPTCKVDSVTPDKPLVEARHLMKKLKIRKLVVVDDKETLVGVITQTDLSRAIQERLTLLAVTDDPLHVKEVMSSKIISTETKTPFSKAKTLMAKNRISALPVTKNKKYVGIFTEYDVVTQFYDSEGKLQIKDLPSLMKSPIKVVPGTLNIFDANMIMLFEKVRRLLVVEEGEVVGIVTQTDIVHSCLDYVEKLDKKIKERADFFELFSIKKKASIISEYAGKYLRAYKTI